jgi:hypothetical protein
MPELLYISGKLVPSLQSQYGYVYHEIIHTNHQYSFSFVRDKRIGDQHLDFHSIRVGQLSLSESLPGGRSDTANFLANAQARGRNARYFPAAHQAMRDCSYNVALIV